jgi:hypothetical protein
MLEIRTYTKLQRISGFESRYDYLRLSNVVGKESFGFDRYLNQAFYRSREWRRIRDIVITRDEGCDLGVSGYDIGGRIIIHHMNPISLEDLEHGEDSVLNPEFLVCASENTHQAIHYGNKEMLPKLPVARYSGDTVPWRIKEVR